MTESAEPVNLTDSFLKAVGKDGWGKAEVDGIIDLSGETDVELAVEGLTFKHGLVADAATLAGLTFENCTFNAPLKLRNSRIVGDLTLRGCTFTAGDDGRPEPRAVDLRGTVVHGSLEVRGSTLAGSLRLDRAVVRGNFLVREQSRVDGATNFSGASVDSQVELSGSNFGEIVFSGSTLGSLWVGSREAVTCTGLYASDTEVKTFARLSRLRVEVGKGARGRKRLHLEEPGTIAFRSCRFGSLFSTWIVKRYDEQEHGWQKDNLVTAETAFLFTDCHVKGELTLSRLRVGRGEPERAIDGKGDPVIARPAAGGKPWGHARLDRTRVDGAFLMLSPISVAHRFELSAEARRKALEKSRGDPMAPPYRAHMRSLAMRDFKASYIDLSGLSLHACGGEDGDGAIDGCLVADRLEVTSSVTTYAWLAEKAGPAEEGPEPKAPASAAPVKVRAYTEVPGSARFRGARIGELRLAAESFGTTQNCVAHEKGVVLELATIGQLRVPPRRGHPCGHDNDFPVPLDLSGLTVRHWNFDEDVNAEGSGDVDHYLDFLDNDEKLHREVYRSVASALRDVGRDEDSEKILYTEETRARWERHHPDRRWPPYPRAGRRGRRRRDLRTRLNELGHDALHPFEWADRYFLQYRRNPIRLLYLILLLLFVSTAFVSSRPANFELSDSSRLVLENARPGRDFSAGVSGHPSGFNIGPDHRNWGLWKAVWMSIRYHVPIVPMVVEDEYVASNDNRLDVGLPLFLEPARWRKPGEDPGRIWFTAEDWFALMSIFNWIMWPLLLTFALRRALRAE